MFSVFMLCSTSLDSFLFTCLIYLDVFCSCPFWIRFGSVFSWILFGSFFTKWILFGPDTFGSFLDPTRPDPFWIRFGSFSRILFGYVLDPTRPVLDPFWTLFLDPFWTRFGSFSDTFWNGHARIRFGTVFALN